MRDYSTTFRLQGFSSSDTLECDLLHGTAGIEGSESFRIPHADVDAVLDALEDFKEDYLYDISPVNDDGDWMLIVEGSLRYEKAGVDVPPELERIARALLGPAQEAGCDRAAYVLMDILELMDQNPSDSYLRFYSGELRGPLDRGTALQLVSEARTDGMLERSRDVAERVFLDLLEQAGYEDVVRAWRRWMGERSPMLDSRHRSRPGGRPSHRAV